MSSARRQRLRALEYGDDDDFRERAKVVESKFEINRTSGMGVNNYWTCDVGLGFNSYEGLINYMFKNLKKFEDKNIDTQ